MKKAFPLSGMTRQSDSASQEADVFGVHHWVSGLHSWRLLSVDPFGDGTEG